MNVHGLDLLDRREQPQRRTQHQEVGAKGGCLGIRAGATLLQNALEFARNQVQPGLQTRSVKFTAAEPPPVGEQAFHDVQTYPASCDDCKPRRKTELILTGHGFERRQHIQRNCYSLI